MRAQAVSDGDTLYWTVTGAPDWAGASAPEAVTDVVLLGESS